jgi:hypothetical protein
MNDHQKQTVASLYSISSIKSNEHLIHKAGVSKLKKHLQRAAMTGETLNLMEYLTYLTFVSDHDHDCVNVDH